MKVTKLKLNDFMLFHTLELEWSSGINAICGDNSTGKTVLLKTIYSVMQAFCKTSEDASKEEMELNFAKKLRGVFRPDENNVGRLVRRSPGNGRAEIEVEFDGRCRIGIDFKNRSSKRVNVVLKNLDLSSRKAIQPIYLPPKEIISTTENFASLYEDYQIAFEETYYDLAKLLDRPLRKGANTSEQNLVLEKFEAIMSGKVTQRDKKFFLNVPGTGEFEMGLVSEGYRKLSTILYLVSSGSLNRETVLFWDEPETNMNPRMIRPIAEVILELAKMGVQVFITTHDYFVQQEFNLPASYPSANPGHVDIQFVSLYRDSEGQLAVDQAKQAGELERNLIMEEFDELYNREQEILDGE